MLRQVIKCARTGRSIMGYPVRQWQCFSRMLLPCSVAFFIVVWRILIAAWSRWLILLWSWLNFLIVLLVWLFGFRRLNLVLHWCCRDLLLLLLMRWDEIVPALSLTNLIVLHHLLVSIVLGQWHSYIVLEIRLLLHLRLRHHLLLNVRRMILRLIHLR